MRIKCDFCERATTQGVGERSGFGHIKGRIGKGKNERKLNIYSCPDHSDEAAKALENFLTAKV
ncbi:MAG: hypothetical protein MUP81_01035 [Dehalococcoidia bacterium]|nr:hypothetical protein [Dehalococcoidia bacterium]